MARDLMRLMEAWFASPLEANSQAVWEPAADIYRTSEGWLVKFDLAGVRPEDIELSVQGCRLLLRGTRRDGCLEEGCHFQLMEIAYSQFERDIVLPCDLDGANIAAEHRDGMLLVRIQREAKP